ncbi:complement component C1q receptor-like [Callorhinchus milii]|uniref:complement component C1q receptor-like n=1 Tax=Callorhinchus milii TaxID=7868 RepID=UPI0004574E71|nr:complement component C1q receptor-like [Callorhinchus milii]|eukprot:gi/632953935/ref/XP_007892693.1/ PREDICTED: complement component C1q receptor-like [Callorhinchus milii]
MECEDHNSPVTGSVSAGSCAIPWENSLHHRINGDQLTRSKGYENTLQHSLQTVPSEFGAAAGRPDPSTCWPKPSFQERHQPVGSGRMLYFVLSALHLWSGPVEGKLPVPSETLCSSNACYTVHLERKPFHKALESCKANGGSLASLKSAEEALQIEGLLASLPSAPSGNKSKFWIGLQLLPRHCYQQHKPLRGFSWTVGGEESQYSNWRREPQSTCTAHRCVYISYYSSGTLNQGDLKWSDSICYAGVEGYLCKFSFKGMCHKISLGGPGSVNYITPFNAKTSSLALVPFGSMATVSCENGIPSSSNFVMCMEMSPKVYDWLKDGPFCTPPPACNSDNGGCAHICVNDGPNGDYHCQCSEGHQLGQDQRSCVPSDPCQDHPCEFGCTSHLSGFECICLVGYELAENKKDCVDTNECAHSPCDQLCFNSVGSFWCDCIGGYTMVSGVCQDVDECSERPCNQSCQNTDGSYQCNCRHGYATHGDGHSCLDINECIEHPCDGMCSNTEGSFECSCNAGYTLHEDNVSCIPAMNILPIATVTEEISETTRESWDLATTKYQMAGFSEWHSPVVRVVSSVSNTDLELKTISTIEPQNPPTGGNIRASSEGNWSLSTMVMVTRTQPTAVAVAPSQMIKNKGEAWLLACVLGSVAATLLLVCVVALVLCRRKRSAKEKNTNASNYYSWMPAAGSSPPRALRKSTLVATSTSADKLNHFEENQTEV